MPASTGLDPASYATPHFENRHYDDPAALAEADVAFTRAVARFVVHVASGSIVPTDISRLITLNPERPDVGEALWRLTQASSVADVIAEYEPPQPQYQLLKAKLAELQALGPDSERIVVPEGKLLKPGMSDDRVALLRQRLKVEAAPETAADLYDDALVEAVRTFQQERDLSVDGIVGPSTLAVLNGRSREEDIAAIVANLERWRWMPRDLGKFHVIVNVPEFVARVVDDGSVVHETRVVVGKPTNRTPTFSNMIRFLIVNPYWNVPVSIVRNELLPEARAAQGGYFARHGYEVFANIGGRMRQVSPGSVNWYAVGANSVRIRQVPGDHNALGRIKFMFPNQHSVYMHDTPIEIAVFSGPPGLQPWLRAGAEPARLRRRDPAGGGTGMELLAAEAALRRSGTAGEPRPPGPGASGLFYHADRCGRRAAPLRGHLRLRPPDHGIPGILRRLGCLRLPPAFAGLS